jgi:hypothetical protein
LIGRPTHVQKCRFHNRVGKPRQKEFLPSHVPNLEGVRFPSWSYFTLQVGCLKSG